MVYGPVVRLPQPQHGLLRVGPRPRRIQTEEAEEERLARRVVELRHEIGDDPDDVKLPSQPPPLPAMRVLHRQHVELHLRSYWNHWHFRIELHFLSNKIKCEKLRIPHKNSSQLPECAGVAACHRAVRSVGVAPDELVVGRVVVEGPQLRPQPLGFGDEALYTEVTPPAFNFSISFVLSV